jgi:uncharacterized membrane protein
MPVEFRCSQCGQLLRVPEETAGEQAQCPVCSAVVDVPVPRNAGDEWQAVGPSEANPYAPPQTMAGEPPVAPGRIHPGRIDLGLAWATTWRLFQEHFAILVGAFVVQVIVLWAFAVGTTAAEAVVAAAQGEQSLAVQVLAWFDRLAGYLLQLFLTVGYLRIQLHVATARPAEMSLLFSGGRYLLRYVVASIAFGLLLLIGLLAFIVPGIYLALKYWPFFYFLIDQDCDVGESFRLAGDYTRGNRIVAILLWLITVALGVVGLLLLFIGLLLTTPLATLLLTVSYLMMTSQMIDEPDVTTWRRSLAPADH